MMKTVLILFSLFLCDMAFAMDAYLVPCEHNADEQCLIGRSFGAPPNAICKVEGDVPEFSVAEDVKQEIITIDESGKEVTLIDRAINALGLKQISESERRRCTIDTDKRQARLDRERAAREAEEQAREAERLKRVEAKAALRAMKGKVKDLTKDEMAEFLEKVIDLQAGE